MSSPKDPLERQVFAVTVDEHLKNVFERRLSRGDLELWHSENTPWPDADTRRIYGLLDNTIIEMAQTFGWRIYVSEVVIKRMARWHDTERGPALIKQLGEAVHLAALGAQGLAKLPVTDRELRAAKAQAVDELRRLLKQCQTVFSLYRTSPADKEVCDWFLETVGTSPEAFPFWCPNIDSLLSALRGKMGRLSGGWPLVTLTRRAYLTTGAPTSTT